MRSRPSRPALLATLTVAAALIGASCSTGGDGTGASTTTEPPSSLPPEGLAPEGPAPGESAERAEEPPEPAWVVQVGGAGDDTLASVTGRNDSVLAVGDTTAELGGPHSGGNDGVVLVVDTEGEVLSLTQSGAPFDDRPRAVGFGSNSDAGDVTIACGSTTSALGGPNAGLGDAWCARVGETDLESVHQQGSTDDDGLLAVALDPEAAAGESGAVGYAAGFSDGLFPGASDTSAGSLGGRDAMFWQLDAQGFPVWIRQFGTPAGDSGEAAAVTSDGDGIIAGRTEGDLDGRSAGGTDAFVARFDGEGLPRWTVQQGSEMEDWTSGVAVAGDPTQGTETIVTVGGTTGSLAPVLGADVTSPLDAPRADGGEPARDNAGSTDALVSAWDATGDGIWTVQLGTPGVDEAIAVASDGQTVLVAGNTDGALATNGDPSAGGTDGFLAAVDRDTGTLRWITQFGTAGEDRVTAITTTEDGLVVVSGTTDGAIGEQPNAGGQDGYLIAFPLPSAGGAVASAL